MTITRVRRPRFQERGSKPESSVDLQVVHLNNVANIGQGHDVFTVTAEADGTIASEWFVNPDDWRAARFCSPRRDATPASWQSTSSPT